ncbi:MAG: T9SS type A sorting domain-containing protein [Bacteroidota bacterium]|nr:T9SS type A sorting domain-containing protein [Bacteroidota bacterium]
MFRWFRVGAAVALCLLMASSTHAQLPIREVSGRVDAKDVRIFVRDTLYRISGNYVIAGTLIIEPGTRVEFLPNGRIIDSTGGRIIADGRARAFYNFTNPPNYQSIPRPGGGTCYDYSDPAYFLNATVITRTTQIEPTIHPQKYDIVFHVILDTLLRRIENLPPLPYNAQGRVYVQWPTAVNPPGTPSPPAGQLYIYNLPTVIGANTFFNTKFVVPFEYAIMWITARLENPSLDPLIRTQPWRRFNNQDPSIGFQDPRTPYRIRFVGVGSNLAREWGHIIILPGARAAFFRECDFDNFRKDTTVDRVNIYQNPAAGDVSNPNSINGQLQALTQGSGGALSVLSSRTWLVDCFFTRNTARYHGGALQFLQAPLDATNAFYPSITSGPGATQFNSLPASYLPADVGAAMTPARPSHIVNQYLFEHNASNTSTLLPPPRRDNNAGSTNYIRAHDNLYDGTINELEDSYRQSVDDGRLAIYLGRVRQVRFAQNRVVNARVRTDTVVTPNGTFIIIQDDLNNPAPVETNPAKSYKNDAFGGAVYISGRWGIHIGLGVNDFQGYDELAFEGNTAINCQQISGTNGARGGALYVTGYTSLVTLGRYRSNSTETPFITDYNAAAVNQGGAIYMSPIAGRLILRGTVQPEPLPMHVIGNRAARGGGIYVAENVNYDPLPSPHIGGFDAPNIQVRNLGYNIKFINNSAKYDGGAIFTRRNYLVYGAGGVISGTLLGYTSAHMVEFSGNTAGYSGGAIAAHFRSTMNQPEYNYIRHVRCLFDNNRVGENVDNDNRANIRGGGALYVLNGELQTTKACEFRGNIAQYGNGGAIALINPKPSTAGTPVGGIYQRVFVTDLDQVLYGSNPAFITGFTSYDPPFTFDPNEQIPPHVRMLTRFLDNRATPNVNRMGSGWTQQGNIAITHPGTGVTTGPDAGIGGPALQENGTGLGGAIYILDQIVPARAGRVDSIFFNRVRFQNQQAYSGAVIYSDNYDLKLVMSRCFIANNTATSQVGSEQNVITGPYVVLGGQTYNQASSDLAGAIIYGEVIGPVPSTTYSVAANSIYDNTARFLIRLPDAPNTKGVLAGTTGIGYGGVDTLRGNYWGRTEANVTTKIYKYDANGDPIDSLNQETFFVAGDGTQQLRYVRNGSGKDQGPFESIGRFTYVPIPALNGANDRTPAANSIPEKLLQQGRVYDIFDKGVDIKTADYSARRMAPIEDFAVGIPTRLQRFSDPLRPSFNKFVKRYTRDPFIAEADPNVAALQTEFVGDHPIGYPLFLEARADYSSLAPVFSNLDSRSINETVFFVINTTTGDYIRVNLKQVDASSEVFRARVEIVPDSTFGGQVLGGYAARRNAEGLANFGGDLTSILAAIKRNAFNEDAGALQGRKYMASVQANQLGGSGFRLSNRPSLPASNQGMETYFAGERYVAIPAKAGDEIAIVSRSVLWREVGANTDAFNGALIFRVGTSTPPPVWTGHKVLTHRPPLRDQNCQIVTDGSGNPILTPPQFWDRIWVSEDVEYSRERALTIPCRDTIFAITAKDTNKFYDPRAIIEPNKYTQLTYGWQVQPGSGLSYWLKADTIPARDDEPNGYWQAYGHIVLKGRPTNPFIVPGGELVTVSARNHPPTYRTVDLLKAAGYSDDVIAKYIYLYPPYFANQAYDSPNARYLQQDTVDFGWNADTVYQFRIFVTDSVPVFTDVAAACPGPDPNTLYANLTDSLRFKVDFTTDDEEEDAAAEALGWNFRYGRTSYAFLSRNEQGRDIAFDELSQARPSWLANAYLRKYDNPSQPDPLAVDFTTKGQINVRIPAPQAYSLLTPNPQYNGAYNTDTVITIAANDGHGGVSYITRRVIVNIAPTITTTSLPDAVEDEDYNVALSDLNKRIRVYDPNFGQTHRYELIYSNDPRKGSGIPKDNCFPEAGVWDISNASTPDWLKINQTSGLLYGTPRVKDTNFDDTTVQVTVLVTDEGGLTHVKTLPLRIIARNHDPEITGAPRIRCVESGKAFEDTVYVRDIDIVRDETLTITVVSPPGVTVQPSQIPGYRATNQPIPVRVIANPLVVNPYQTSIEVVLVVTDKHNGRPDTLRYRIAVSEPTTFTVDMRISNAQGAFEILTWGAAPNATTGDNSSRGGIGKLDSNYCEYELPVIPPVDIFDARWTIPNRYGTLVNIFPTCAAGNAGIEAYKGRFQSGGVSGNTANYLPVRISWNKSQVPSRTDAQRNPCGGTYYLQNGTGGTLYRVNMSTGAFTTESPGNYEVTINGDEVTLIIKSDADQTFVILWDQASDVAEEPVAGERATLYPVSPNPIDGQVATIRFSLPVGGPVKLEVIDNLGHVVDRIADGVYSPGVHSLTWDSSMLSSGSYVLKLSTASTTSVQRVTIVR